MSTYSEFANSLASIIQSGANAQAETQRQRGQIWGNALSNIGQIVADIPRQRAQQQELQLRAQAQQLETDKLKQQANDLKALDQAYQQPGGRDAIISALPGHLRPMVQKQFDDLDKAHAETQSAKEKLSEAQTNTFGRAATIVREHGYDPLAAQGMISDLKGKYADDPQTLQGLQQFEQELHANPTKEWVQQKIDPLIMVSEQRKSDLEAAKLKGPTTPGRIENETELYVAANDPQNPLHQVAIDALAAKAAQKPAGEEPVITVRTMENGKPVEKVLPRSQAVGQTFPSQPPMSVLFPKPEAPAGASELTPEGVDYAATQYRVTGQMPALGMGKTPARAQIINRAAEQAKILGQTPAAAIQKQAAFKADSNALKQMQTLSSGAEAAENKAIGQIAIIKDLSAKVPRTQFPLINSALQAGRVSGLGDSNAQQLANAIQTFSQEYGKIIEGSTASVAGASDTSRRAAGKLVNASMNPKTLNDVLGLMNREMDLTLGGYGATIDHITNRMGGTTTTTTAPSPVTPPVTTGTIRARDPQGKLHEAAAGTPLPAGWTLEK